MILQALALRSRSGSEYTTCSHSALRAQKVPLQAALPWEPGEKVQRWRELRSTQGTLEGSLKEKAWGPHPSLCSDFWGLGSGVPPSASAAETLDPFQAE